MVLSVKRITYINNKYPNPPIVVFKQGEDIQGSNLKIKVVDSDIMDKEVFEKNYAEFDENPDNEQLMNQEMKITVIKSADLYLLISLHSQEAGQMAGILRCIEK